MKSGAKKDNLWRKLTGIPSEFSLEVRIFHSICVIGLLVLAYHVPFNYYIGLPAVSLISLILFVLLAIAYYLSRLQNRFNTSIIFFISICNVLLCVVYYYNSGINGTGLLIFALIIYLTIAIVPQRQYKIWLPLNILIVSGLLTAEFLYPDWIPYTYQNTLSRFIDFLSAYIVVIILMYYSIKYIRSNYDYEKKSAEDKALDIEKQNQQILMQNAQLERLDVEKNKLFSIVAHDLKTPLASVQSYLELLTEVNLKEEEKQEIEKSLLAITRNTSDMLSNLLSWAVAQKDGVTVKSFFINLYNVLYNTLEVEKSIAVNKGIEFVYEIDTTIGLKADADMLQLVIRNLVNNSIKFTDTGGKILINARSHENECQIVIKDSGIGISYDQQESVFSLKAKSTFGTNNEKGVGLGLLLCKEFTELQGGRIWFESTPGEGTIFYVSMPLS